MKYYDTWYFIVNFQKALEMEAKYCLKLCLFDLQKSNTTAILEWSTIYSYESKKCLS